MPLWLRGNALARKSQQRGTCGPFCRCWTMATHGENRMNGNGMVRPLADASSRIGPGLTRVGSDAWHRRLTGRQSPEPVSAKLRMIYGNIVAEELPDRMLDLLSQLDQKRSEEHTSELQSLMRISYAVFCL